MNDIEKNYEDFISTVSHELRTPLTSIRGFSQTMLASWDKLDDDSKKKFIKIIEDQSNRLIHLVENMLSVTKLQGDKNIVYSEIDVQNVIDQTISIIKNQYPDQKFEVNYKDNHTPIFADKDKFQQVMTNLIENSAKYSIGENTTRIATKLDDNKVITEVSNTGIGIDENSYEKIFTKFARIDNPLTRKVQGSGLGLYITKNIVEKMNGKITVNSEPTENSQYSNITFTVEFPILDIEQQARIKCNQ